MAPSRKESEIALFRGGSADTVIVVRVPWSGHPEGHETERQFRDIETLGPAVGRNLVPEGGKKNHTARETNGLPDREVMNYTPTTEVFFFLAFSVDIVNPLVCLCFFLYNFAKIFGHLHKANKNTVMKAQ